MERAATSGIPEKAQDELRWSYDCLCCKAGFETPVPRGPREEREARCPHCGSGEIQRLHVECPDPVCGG